MDQKRIISAACIIATTIFLFLDNANAQDFEEEAKEGALAQEERKSPFIPQFPVVEKVVETPAIEQPVEIPVIIEEKTFNVSVYRLEGVVWGAYAPKAIINSKIYTVGDIIDEAEVKKIDKAGVTVLFNEEEYVIRTKNPFIEQVQEEVPGEDTQKQ